MVIVVVVDRAAILVETSRQIELVTLGSRIDKGVGHSVCLHIEHLGGEELFWLMWKSFCISLQLFATFPFYACWNRVHLCCPLQSFAKLCNLHQLFTMVPHFCTPHHRQQVCPIPQDSIKTAQRRKRQLTAACAVLCISKSLQMHSHFRATLLKCLKNDRSDSGLALCKETQPQENKNIVGD